MVQNNLKPKLRDTTAHFNVHFSSLTIDDVHISRVTHTLTEVTSTKKSLTCKQPSLPRNVNITDNNNLPVGHGCDETLNESLTLTNF